MTPVPIHASRVVFGSAGTVRPYRVAGSVALVIPRPGGYDHAIVGKLKPRLRPLSEAEAYHRCHGERISDVKIVHLEPRRPRYRTLVKGEDLRQAFERKLARRETTQEHASEHEGSAVPLSK
jgi:hypothetical protein